MASSSQTLRLLTGALAALSMVHCSASEADAPIDAGNPIPDIIVTSDPGAPLDSSSHDGTTPRQLDGADSGADGSTPGQPDGAVDGADIAVDVAPDTAPDPCGQCLGSTPHCLKDGDTVLGCVMCLEDEHCNASQTCSSNYLCGDPPPPPPSKDGIEWLCESGECWGKDGRCLPDEVGCKDGAECVTLTSIFGEPPLPDDEDPGGWCACPAGACEDGLTCGAGPLGILASLVGRATVPDTCFK